MKKEIILLLSSISIAHVIQSAYTHAISQPTYSTPSYTEPSPRVVTTHTPVTTARTVTPAVTTQSVQAGTVSVNIYYTEPRQLFNKNRSMTIDLQGPFTIQDIESGLSLHVSLYPPPNITSRSTSPFAQRQQPSYLIVAFLRSNDGAIVARQEQKIALTTPPSDISVSYEGNPISSTKSLFKTDTRLSSSSNKVFFNKKAPLVKKFFIQKTDSGVIAK